MKIKVCFVELSMIEGWFRHFESISRPNSSYRPGDITHDREVITILLQIKATRLHNTIVYSTIDEALQDHRDNEISITDSIMNIIQSNIELQYYTTQVNTKIPDPIYMERQCISLYLEHVLNNCGTDEHHNDPFLSF